MMIEPDDVDWSQEADSVVMMAAHDGIKEAQAEMEKRAAAQEQRRATNPRRPISY